MTGGRLARAAPYLKDEREFCFTYGDGVADIDIGKQLAFHRAHGRAATITAVQPPGRYGALELSGQSVRGFIEKPKEGSGWINGGFFVLTPQCLGYLGGDQCVWEGEPLTRLASEGQLMAYQHSGFWQPMDTLREKTHLEQLWASGSAPWKMWR
jgi:glucose-1-phosphate cytidylyltransferase